MRVTVIFMSKSRRVNMNANALSFSYYYGHHSDVR
jgi:hypothetical protein